MEKKVDWAEDRVDKPRADYVKGTAVPLENIESSELEEDKERLKKHFRDLLNLPEMKSSEFRKLKFELEEDLNHVRNKWFFLLGL